jgi:hypothetical protein
MPTYADPGASKPLSCHKNHDGIGSMTIFSFGECIHVRTVLLAPSIGDTTKVPRNFSAYQLFHLWQAKKDEKRKRFVPFS